METVARKEVNFKSKLIEWTQKNKVTASFDLIEQFLDQESNPVFQTEILVEGISAGTGIGYSKKESQQNAAKMALKKIQTVPKFINEVFESAQKRRAEAEKTQKEAIQEVSNAENLSLEIETYDAVCEMEETNSNTITSNSTVPNTEETFTSEISNETNDSEKTDSIMNPAIAQ